MQGVAPLPHPEMSANSIGQSGIFSAVMAVWCAVWCAVPRCIDGSCGCAYHVSGGVTVVLCVSEWEGDGCEGEW